jgi:hypothetical protein
VGIKILNNNILTTYDWALNTGLLAEKGGRPLNAKIINQTAANFLKERLKIEPHSFNSAGTQLLSHIFNTVYAKAHLEENVVPQRLSKEDILRLGAQIEGLLPKAYSHLSFFSFKVQRAVACYLERGYLQKLALGIVWVLISYHLFKGLKMDDELLSRPILHQIGPVLGRLLIVFTIMIGFVFLAVSFHLVTDGWSSINGLILRHRVDRVRYNYVWKEGQKLHEIWLFIMTRNQSIKWMGLKKQP